MWNSNLMDFDNFIFRVVFLLIIIAVVMIIVALAFILPQLVSSPAQIQACTK